MKHKAQRELNDIKKWVEDCVVGNLQETVDNTLTPFEVGYIMGLITMDGNMPNYSWFTKFIEKLERQKEMWVSEDVQ